MKLNILYFVCHDLGSALGCYGAGIPTPHLDGFAQSGVRFTNAHCASPACSPSRACAMSGLHAHTSGALGLSHMGWPLDLKWQTTVDDFNAAGYQTILSGINHERHPRRIECPPGRVDERHRRLCAWRAAAPLGAARMGGFVAIGR